MILTIILRLLELLIGFAGGIAVGAAYVALLTFLGVVPRLIQLSGTAKYIQYYAIPLVTGTMVGTFFSFTDTSYELSLFWTSLWGLAQGVFVGMLAAALVEVLNVFPLLSRRVGLERYIRILLMAVVLGKVCGSLFQWIFFTS